MKRRVHRLTIFCLAAGSVALSGAAMSEEWKPGASVDAQVKMMDSNGDGKVSAEEHAAGAEKMFRMIDANKDGNVTAEEMDAAHEAGSGPKDGMSSGEKIKMIDGNGDGVLSASEHAAGSLSMFTKTDTDKDGSLTAREIKAAHEAMMGEKSGR